MGHWMGQGPRDQLRFPTINHPVPAYLGIGSFEDSMRSVRDIQPKVPPYGPAGKEDPQALKAKLQCDPETQEYLY